MNMKNNLTVLGVLMLTLLVTSCMFWVGCANVKRALFESRPPPPGVTNNVDTIRPRRDVVDGVSAVGSLFGPDGKAVAALVTAGLGLVAGLLNRVALRKHLAAKPIGRTSVGRTTGIPPPPVV